MIAPTAIPLDLADGLLGDYATITSMSVKKVNDVIHPMNYKKTIIPDQYNELGLHCIGDFGIIFPRLQRCGGVSFLFKTERRCYCKKRRRQFQFTDNYKSFISVQWDYRDGKIFNSSFEALHHEIRLSQFSKDSPAFLPLLVEAGVKKWLCWKPTWTIIPV